MNIDHLSYPVRKKTGKILELKNEMKNQKKIIRIPKFLTFLCGVYIMVFYQRYLDVTVSAINPWSDVSRKIHTQDIIVLMILLGSAFFMYIYYISYNKIKSDFEALRKDLKKDIDTEFCKCSQPQKCKDEYIEEMEEEGIDLIF